MLGLITWDEIWNVINLSKDKANDGFMEGPTRRFIETYKARPGFFTAYESGQKFAGGLIAIVAYPAALSITATISAICAVIATVMGLGCMFVAVGAALWGSYELCDDCIDDASTFFLIAGLAFIATAVSSFLAAVSLFHAPLSFLTRTGASFVSLVSDCVVKSSVKQEENMDKIIECNTLF